MSQKTLKIGYNNGNPQFNPPVTAAIDLDEGDSVVLQLQSFPSGSSIDTVTVYKNKNDGGDDEKGDKLCEWTRSGGNDCTVYDIAADSDTEVTITDTEDPTSPDKYWFSASGTDGSDGSDWSVDPELINKPSG